MFNSEINIYKLSSYSSNVDVHQHTNTVAHQESFIMIERTTGTPFHPPFMFLRRRDYFKSTLLSSAKPIYSMPFTFKK